MRPRWVLVPLSALVAACGTLLGVQSDDGANPPPAGNDAATDRAEDATTDGIEPAEDAPPGDALPDVDNEAGSPRPLHVFVTSGTYATGAMLKGSAADDACNKSAMAGRLDGGAAGFVAWLSTQSKNAKDKVTGVGPFVDTHGNMIANSRAVLLSGTLENPIHYTEDGGTTGGQVVVWTGTKSDGTWSGFSCGAWDDSNATNLDTEGQTDDTTRAWTDRSPGTGYNDCLSVTGLHLYCFEQP